MVLRSFNPLQLPYDLVVYLTFPCSNRERELMINLNFLFSQDYCFFLSTLIFYYIVGEETINLLLGYRMFFNRIFKWS